MPTSRAPWRCSPAAWRSCARSAWRTSWLRGATRLFKLLDPARRALALLRVRGSAHLLVRPDGHIGYHADINDVAGVGRYLTRVLSCRS